MSAKPISEPGKMLLLASLLAKQRVISNNGKSFLKELVLRRDTRLTRILAQFENKSSKDSDFLEGLHDLIRDESNSVFNDLFSDTSLEVGKSLSKKEREDKNLQEEKSLIYGEVEFKSFYSILRKINPKPGLTFFDLGSGTGKALYAARITQDFDRCIGIEILKGLHNQAFHVTERFNKDVRHLLDAGQRQHAAVYAGSFLDFDWTSGDVIFANSTCYEEGLMRDMSIMAQKLKPGAIMVTFTRGLLEIEGKFELLEKKRQKMSWGPATVFIHRRLKEDGMPVGPPNLNILPCDTVEYEDPADRDDDSDDDEEEEEDDEDDYSEEDDSEESEESEDDDDAVEFDSDYDSEEARWVDEEMADFKARHSQYFPAEKPAPQSPGDSRTRLSVPPPSPGPSAGIMGGMGGFSSPQDSSLQKRKAAKKAFSGWSN